MARSVDSDTQALLDAYRAAARDVILFDFGSDGTHGFWSGAGPFTHNGQEYIGAASLFEVEPVEESVGLESNAVQISLRAVPEAGLTPDVLASIEDYDYKQTEVTLSVAFFDPDTHAFVSLEPLFNGLLDQISHDEDGRGGYRLVLRAESRSRDHTRTGYRRRSHEDQKLIKSNDGGLKHAAQAGLKRIVWGRQGQEPAVRRTTTSRSAPSNLNQIPAGR